MLHCSKPGQGHRCRSGSLAARLPCQATVASCCRRAAVLVLRNEPRGAQPGARLGRRHAAVLQEPGQSAVVHHLRQNRRRDGRGTLQRSTRRYSRPEWRITSTLVGGERVPVQVTTVWERPFCQLVHFERIFERHRPRRPQPRLLIVAPMSDISPRCCAARSKHSCPITTSTSPIRSTPALCR